MQTWGLTDPGNIRQQNQDSYAIVPFARDRVLMIVCDGMGGAKSGNVASSLAVEVFTDEVRRTQRPGMTPEKAAAMLRSALELSNSAVYEQSQLSEDFTGMGTTLVAAFLSRDLAVIINVGDSRAYHFTREDVSLVTRDHSMVAYMVERGELTQEQAKEEPKTVERPHESVKKFEPEPKPEEFRVKKLVSIPVGLSDNAKKIYEAMGEEPLFADEIAAKTGFAPWEVVSSMTELELEDLVCLCAGKRYKKI